jgi:hypothetical protein
MGKRGRVEGGNGRKGKVLRKGREERGGGKGKG